MVEPKVAVEGKEIFFWPGARIVQGREGAEKDKQGKRTRQKNIEREGSLRKEVC